MCFSSLVLSRRPNIFKKLSQNLKNTLTPIGSCRDLHTPAIYPQLLFASRVSLYADPYPFSKLESVYNQEVTRWSPTAISPSEACRMTSRGIRSILHLFFLFGFLTTAQNLQTTFPKPNKSPHSYRLMPGFTYYLLF